MNAALAGTKCEPVDQELPVVGHQVVVQVAGGGAVAHRVRAFGEGPEPSRAHEISAERASSGLPLAKDGARCVEIALRGGDCTDEVKGIECGIGVEQIGDRPRLVRAARAEKPRDGQRGVDPPCHRLIGAAFKDPLGCGLRGVEPASRKRLQGLLRACLAEQDTVAVLAEDQEHLVDPGVQVVQTPEPGQRPPCRNPSAAEEGIAPVVACRRPSARRRRRDCRTASSIA